MKNPNPVKTPEGLNQQEQPASKADPAAVPSRTPERKAKDSLGPYMGRY